MLTSNSWIGGYSYGSKHERRYNPRRISQGIRYCRSEYRYLKDGRRYLLIRRLRHPLVKGRVCRQLCVRHSCCLSSDPNMHLDDRIQILGHIGRYISSLAKFWDLSATTHSKAALSTDHVCSQHQHTTSVQTSNRHI